MGRRKTPAARTGTTSAVLPRIGQDRLAPVDVTPPPGGWTLDTAAEAALAYADEYPATRYSTRALAVAAFHAIAGSTTVDLVGAEIRERLQTPSRGNDLEAAWRRSHGCSNQ